MARSRRSRAARCRRCADGQPANGGDLMTIDTFGDFELSFEWKVAPGANSGVKYNVSEEFSLDARVEPCGARLRVPGARRFAQRRQQDSVAPRGLALRSIAAERREAPGARRPVEHVAHRLPRQPRRALAQRREDRRVRPRHAAHGFAAREEQVPDDPRFCRSRERDTSFCRTTTTRRTSATSRFGS